jgi:hypothetical protein
MFMLKRLNLAPYCLVFCQKKQENVAILRLSIYFSVIPARFWPESSRPADPSSTKGGKHGPAHIT